MSIWLRRPETLPAYFARDTEPGEPGRSRPSSRPWRRSRLERCTAILVHALPAVLDRANKRGAAAW